MKQLTFVLCIFCAATLTLFSCKKEKSYEGGAPVTDSLLVKTVSQVGTDSVVYSYGYDASRRLISRNYVSANQGVNDNEQITIRRNTQGIILQIIHKSDSLKANGLDSLVYNVNYNAAKAQYTSQVATLTISGITVSDSTAYSYDNNGKLIRSEEFIGAASLGGYANYVKTDYTYDAGNNVADAKTSLYDPTSSAYQLVYEDGYTYDANVNPLKQLGVEAFLLEDATLYSTHNVASVTSTDYTDPTNDDVLSLTYTYNTQNKPAIATSVYKSSGAPVPTVYYYKL